MIPEIRAWIPAKKKMVVVNMMEYQVQEFDWFNNLGGWLKWSDAVFMMLTEMADRDGHKIWESDIVAVLNAEGYEMARGEVIYNPDAGLFQFRMKDGSTKMFPPSVVKVIGNIFEDPDLLK